MKKASNYRTRLERQRSPSVTGGEQHQADSDQQPSADAIVDCG